jgi:hypothetical protein
MHKYRVFLTVVEKIILICQCHTGEVGKSQLRRQGSKAKDQHGHGFCPIDNPSKASKTILYLTFQKSQCKRPFIVIMTDVSVCQTEGFQAVWRFLRLFRNLQIMTH